MIAEILSKVGGNSSKVDSNVIHLSSPSIVQLKIAPEQVQKFERIGQDLKMVLPDGKSVVIEGFFDKDVDGNRSDLVLEDSSGVLWWGQYPAQWDGFHFTEINEHAAGIPPWLWAGLGLLGLGGAAAGLAGGGGDGGSDGDGPPMMPTVTVPDANGVETGDVSIAENATTPATGEFTVDAPDGLDHITVNGTDITVAQLNDLGTTPVTITGTEGDLTLTGYDPATGKVTYEYQQNGTSKDHSGGDVTDSFTITVTDNGGDTSPSDDLDVLITDTAPTANADVNSVTEDATDNTATGNVVTDAGTGQDEPGADGVTVTGVAAGTSAGDVSGDVGTAITGSYGTLTLNSDGSYTYTLDNGNTDVNALKDGDKLTDTFSYTITDGDGDTSTTTLKITVDGNTDGAPTVTVPDGNGVETGDVSIAENATTPATGEFTVDAPDGLDHITVGGTDISIDQLEDLGTTPVTITGAEGDLTLTGYDPATGKVTYEYQQNGTSKDHSGGDDSVTDKFTITVTDNGGSSSGGDDLVVLITDTEPVANPDTNSVTEDATDNTATGNVVTDAGTGQDETGADDVTVTDIASDNVAGNTSTDDGSGVLTIDGEYGQLEIHPDGSYTYTLDNGNTDVNALKDGETLTDTFSYTITDGDGDTSTTTLKITVDGSTDGASTVTVPDANGVETGDVSIAEDATTPATGEFTVDAPDGLDHITVGGTDVTIDQLNGLGTTTVTVTGTEGDLTLTGYDPATGKVTYEYQQNGTSKDHSGGDDSVTDKFTITVTDNGGGTSPSDDLDVLITDTAPTANADVNSVTEDATDNTATGNVVTDAGTGQDKLGADDATPDNVTGVAAGTSAGDVSGSVGTAITGSYGTLTLNADGSYTYTLDNGNTDVNALKDGETLTDTFSYTITDGDGDTSTTTLKITVDGNTDGDPAVTVPDANGVETGDVSIAEDATTPATGEFTVDAPDGLDHITVGGTDVTIDQLNDLGTTPVTITGTEGDLTLTGYDPATGKVTYEYQQSGTSKDHSGGDDSVTDKFTITVTDNGGDTSPSDDLDVLITDTEPTAHADTNSVTEDATDNTATGNVVTDAGTGQDELGADDATPNNVTGVAAGTSAGDVSGSVGTDIAGSYGTLKLNADGSYTYELDNSNTDVDALKDGETLTDTFSYTITDGDGDTSTTTLKITVDGANDAPVITESDQTGAVTEAGNLDDGTVVSGIPDDTGDFNATDVEGDTLTWSVAGTPDTTYGTFSVDPATGTWTYDLDNTKAATQALNEGDTVDLTYSVQVSDGQGGTETRDVTITITGTNDSPVAVADTDTVTESGVLDGGNTATAGDLSATGNVLTNDTDVDDGEKATLEVSDVAFDGTAGTLGSALAGTYGSLTLDADGGYTYTLNDTDANVDALKQGETVTETFTYTAVDANGATSTNTLTITVTGTNDQPTITSDAAAASGEVTEAGTGVLGTDTDSGTLTADDVDADATQTWGIADTTGTYGTISIDSATGKWTYTLDNDDADTQALNDGDIGTETFTARVTDEHGAYSEQTITIDVNGSNDDVAGNGDKTVTLTEDDSASGTLQDYVHDVDDTLKVTSFSIDTDGDGTDETYTMGGNYTSGDSITLQDADGNVRGTLTINEDGSYGFTPAGNYAGDVPVVTYTMTEDKTGGQSVTQTLTFDITKVADAPGLDADKTVGTNEDTAASLGLTAPVITDTGTGTGNGDYPERLGEITLTVGGDGASGVTLATGSTTLTPVGGKITIVLTDVDHVTSVPAEDNINGVYYLTKAEYEALAANPLAESGKNFTVTVDAISYEVDSTGTIIAGVSGATNTQVIDVDVQAVTDGATLTIDGTTTADLTGAEDAAIDVGSHLAAALNDTDGDGGAGNGSTDADTSETYWYTITGLPAGTVVTIDGVATTISATVTEATSPVSTSATPPSITIAPPANFSGDINDVTVTLNSKDTDGDSSGTIGTESSSVTLDLHVTPVAGDIKVADVSTDEDTAVAFLAGVQVTDTDSAGNEVIDSISFETPAGWDMTPPSGGDLAVDGWALTGTGASGDPYVITFNNDDSGGTVLTEGQREGVLDGFTITPPAHSSLDETISLSITNSDTSSVNGTPVTDTKITSHDVKVTVTPVAEEISDGGTGTGAPTSDTDGDGTPDLTINPDHDYATAGAEDAWFSLANDPDGGGGFALEDGWSNQDTSEKTFASLTPELIDGDGGQANAIGSQFRWSEDGGATWEVRTYVGDPIDVPTAYLSTLEFMAAPDFSGMFKIKVQAHTVDTDENGGTTVEATSGESWLSNILIKPVADDVTVALNGHAVGKEDTSIPLTINPTSSDPSETFNITISGIPEGAIITYGGTTYDTTGVLPPELTLQPDGKFELVLSDFKSTTPLSIQPPLNSNEDFTLKVGSESVDTLTVTDELGDDQTYTVTNSGPDLTIDVAVTGVADKADVTTHTPSYTEAGVDGATETVKLSDVATVALTDTDGSEALTVRISGLAEGFSPSEGTLLTGPDVTGADRVWVLNQAQYNSATINVPANYSGEVTFQIGAVTTENDGSSRTGTPPTDVSFVVTPSPEAETTTSATLVEDTVSTIGLNIVPQHGDSDETLTSVRIDASQVDGSGFTLYLDDGSGTPTTLADAVTAGVSGISLVTDGGVQYYVLDATVNPDLISQLAAKGGENLDGDLGSFHFQYQITDASYGEAPATTSTTSDWQDADFNLTATPVTDAPDASIVGITAPSGTVEEKTAGDDASPDTVTLSDADTVTVNLQVDSPDQDGSEHLIRVVIDGVPDGVTVTGGEFIGNGQWLLVYDGDNAKPIEGTGSLQVPVEFVVSNQAGAVDTTITMTAQVQDRGDQSGQTSEVETDSASWHLVKTTPAGGIGDNPATINQWEYNDAHATEDASFALSDIITAAVDANSGSPNVLTITLTDLPEGTIITGMTRTTVGGADVWTASTVTADGASDAQVQQALQDLMDSITIAPPPNSNENNAAGDFHFDAQLTTSIAGGHQSNVQIVGDTATCRSSATPKPARATMP